MAFGNITIEIELRPCIIYGGLKGLFHKWIIDESGKEKGIVEDSRGKIHLVRPEKIQFIDCKIKEYNFSKELINHVNKGL